MCPDRTMSAAPGALLIGHWERDEFRAARQHLQRRMPTVIVPDIAQALRDRDLLDAFTLLLIAQSFPAEFAARDVQRLQAAAPLARLCVVLGSWCEGETRSGHPWPGVARIYTHQFAARLRSEDWQAAAATPLVAWSLLPTVTADELGLRRAEQKLPELSGLVLICSDRHETGLALADVCRAVGLRTVRFRPSHPAQTQDADLVLYDADPHRPRRIAHLRWLLSRCTSARVIVLIDFPRRDEIDEVLAAGGREVLGKPYLIDDLIACLQDALVHPNRVC